MNRPVFRAFASAALLAVTFTSCGGSTPASPSRVLTTDTFAGMLSPGQRLVHPYVVKAAGQVTTTLSALSVLASSASALEPGIVHLTGRDAR